MRVRDLESEVPPIESVALMMEFPEVFPENLPRIPSNLYIDFRIDLLIDTQIISNPPYRIALTQLKELSLN